MKSLPILDKVEKYVIGLLSEDSALEGIYHNLNHTLDVVKISDEIAVAEKLSENDYEILMIAAWFHDIGYVSCSEGHEEKSSDFAREFLEQESYPDNKIKLVEDCIKATKIPQKPKNKLEEILCDADLHHLGLLDSEERGELLRSELAKRERKNIPDSEWLKITINFMKKHDFFTEYAKNKFGNQKISNLHNLESKLERIERERKNH